MDVISGTRRSSSSSSLNPNAPMFVPLAYRTVEDFSDEWWALVHSSPWFRAYWLRERFQDPQNDNDTPFSDFELVEDEDEDEDPLFQYHQLDLNLHPQDEEGREGKELVSLGALNWARGGGWAEAPRYAEKAPKIVKSRVSPRAIHQPR